MFVGCLLIFVGVLASSGLAEKTPSGAYETCSPVSALAYFKKHMSKIPYPCVICSKPICDFEGDCDNKISNTHKIPFYEGLHQVLLFWHLSVPNLLSAKILLSPTCSLLVYIRNNQDGVYIFSARFCPKKMKMSECTTKHSQLKLKKSMPYNLVTFKIDDVEDRVLLIFHANARFPGKIPAEKELTYLPANCEEKDPDYTKTIKWMFNHDEEDWRTVKFNEVPLLVPCSPGGFYIDRNTGKLATGDDLYEFTGSRKNDYISTVLNIDQSKTYPIFRKPNKKYKDDKRSNIFLPMYFNEKGKPLSPKELEMRKHSDESRFPTEESERKKRSIWNSLIKRRSVSKANERDQELPPVSQKKESEENWEEKRKVRSNMEKGKTEIGKKRSDRKRRKISSVVKGNKRESEHFNQVENTDLKLNLSVGGSRSLYSEPKIPDSDFEFSVLNFRSNLHPYKNYESELLDFNSLNGDQDSDSGVSKEQSKGKGVEDSNLESFLKHDNSRSKFKESNKPGFDSNSGIFKPEILGQYLGKPKKKSLLKRSISDSEKINSKETPFDSEYGKWEEWTDLDGDSEMVKIFGRSMLYPKEEDHTETNLDSAHEESKWDYNVDPELEKLSLRSKQYNKKDSEHGKWEEWKDVEGETEIMKLFGRALLYPNKEDHVELDSDSEQSKKKSEEENSKEPTSDSEYGTWEEWEDVEGESEIMKLFGRALLYPNKEDHVELDSDSEQSKKKSSSEELVSLSDEENSKDPTSDSEYGTWEEWEDVEGESEIMKIFGRALLYPNKEDQSKKKSEEENSKKPTSDSEYGKWEEWEDSDGDSELIKIFGRSMVYPNKENRLEPNLNSAYVESEYDLEPNVEDPKSLSHPKEKEKESDENKFQGEEEQMEPNLNSSLRDYDSTLEDNMEEFKPKPRLGGTKLQNLRKVLKRSNWGYVLGDLGSEGISSNDESEEYEDLTWDSGLESDSNFNSEKDEAEDIFGYWDDSKPEETFNPNYLEEMNKFAQTLWQSAQSRKLTKGSEEKKDDDRLKKEKK